MDLRTLTRLSVAALALASVALAGCSKTEEPTAPEGGITPPGASGTTAAPSAPGTTAGAPGTTAGAPAKSETPKIEGAAGSATPQ